MIPMPPRPGALTKREAEVLRLLRGGYSYAEIALALHLGVETVRTHARHIRRKLGVRSSRELAERNTSPARSPDTHRQADG